MTATATPVATTRRPRPTTRFVLPPDREATAPPEAHGRSRDDVRLLVARPHGTQDLPFRRLGDALEPGDLVVVNTSATVAAALDARRADGTPVVVHVAGPTRHAPAARHTAGTWVVEVRRVDGRGPVRDVDDGEVVVAHDGTRITLLAPDDPPRRRLWRARLHLDAPVEDHLARMGRPIAYGHLDGRYPLDAYQTVFARHPGSAEMASAARPFTDRLVVDLVTRGIALAPIELHAGVSSLETTEPPRPERYTVPPATARLVEHTRRAGGRIVAVGTTVTRALETVAAPDGRVRPGAGWTDVVLGPDRPARVVDGLLTGWHEPEASHLLLLEAVAGPRLVAAAYDAALAGDHRWHEFGDSCLLLP